MDKETLVRIIDIFAEVVKGPEISRVLESNGLNIDSFPNLDRFKILEYPLPNLSADRIDFILYETEAFKININHPW